MSEGSDLIGALVTEVLHLTMSLLRVINRWLGRGFSRSTTLVAALLAGLILPVPAMASEANIKLEFSASDRIYLYVSLGFGILALAVGFMIMRSVLNRDRGNEKMQEVGNAIQKGAMAYLRQQMSMMSVFVVILGALIFFMYKGTFGANIAAYTAGAMLLGVAASYIAGYVGMYMAVNANMRTAAAALTSYKRALETAFQAGAVAGLMTVGMGLLGATTIFLGFGADATKILIGFGFGGSLAALFMRVGGGIFTKAADVGADLVGKVEAGIPEDDPRNPAVIADNVGDNVGDCAGMAADVFESYEVTLVAAIVLGAATAALFPQEVWIKLILFAMMARGVGILASIFGVLFVKGNEDINFDPLKSIRKGFYGSAGIAIIATVGLAWFMLGGADPAHTVKTNELVSVDQVQREKLLEVSNVINEVATKLKKDRKDLQPADVTGSDEFKALKLEDIAGQMLVAQALQSDPSELPPVQEMEGYSMADLSKEDGIGNLTVFAPPGATPEEVKFQKLSAANMVVVKLALSSPPPPGSPAGTAPTTQERVFGPVDLEYLKKQIELATKESPDNKIEIVGEPYPVQFFANEGGDVVAAVDASPDELDLSSIPTSQLGFEESVEEMEAIAANQTGATQPTNVNASLAYVEHATAQWWQFALCVIFGLVMAFVFEWLTDYYVGLHKRPVQEIGEVATAGPAPMIISGFAYGQESSVFSVFAIVACLIAPLLIFPPGEYGGYLLGFYGIALVGLGLLTTTGFILAMDTFGPISDNAQGVYEMSGANEENPDGARRVQLLDAAGNTTKALTKGFAIATAVVAAVALFHAYVEEGNLSAAGMRLEIPEIFLGLLIGGAAPYLFSAFSIQAVGRAAFELINEVRRQFRSDPGIMAGTSKPDYGRCVAISTKAAQKELLSPGILAIAFPLLVGFGFAIGKPLVTIGGEQYNLVGAQALGGFLAGSILSGQLLAVMLANSGGMWDNSKKLIEDGMHGGKGTDAHKAAVVCDTVGDPFKDTAGPALNPLIKVMNLVALLLAPQVIKPWPTNVQITVAVVAAALLVVAIYLSKRGSLGSEMKASQSDASPEALASHAKTDDLNLPNGEKNEDTESESN